jgi:glycosyltransferase involved in cell wall biosynthesis
LIAGDGPLKKDLESQALDSNLNNIIFSGSVSKNEIASYYNSCDLFILPSIVNNYSYEPWGLVVNEAMVFGKPIITTDAVGSGMDMVTNYKNGFIVENKNTKALFDAINYILSDEMAMHEMGVNSRKRFLEVNDVDKFYNILKMCIMRALYD